MINQHSNLKRVAAVLQADESTKAVEKLAAEVAELAAELESADLDPSTQLIQLQGQVASLIKATQFDKARVDELTAAENLEAAPLQAVAPEQSNAATGTSSHSFWQRNSSLVGVAGVTLGATVGPYCAMVLFTQVIPAAFAISSALATAGLVTAAILLFLGIAALVNHFSNNNTPSLTVENDPAESLQHK